MPKAQGVKEIASNRKAFHEYFVLELQKQLGRPVPTGQFGADMQVSLTNDGPVTIVMDSKNPE